MSLPKTAFVGLIAALSLILLFGCTTTQTDKEALFKFSLLQQKYFVSNGYSSNLTTMNDYVSELSLLAAKSGGESAKIIEAELYSAEAFYYLNKTIVQSVSIDSKQIKCSSNEVKEIITSVKLASDYSSKAVISISALTVDQQNSIRTNQSNLVLGQQEEIEQIKKFFEEKC